MRRIAESSRFCIVASRLGSRMCGSGGRWVSIRTVGVSEELSGSKTVFRIWRSLVERGIEVAAAMMVNVETDQDEQQVE